MGIRLRPLPKFQFLTDAGDPGAGYKVYCYQPGTTTLKDTYTDYTGGTPNANPVILDSRGEASIWFSGTYKIKITDADDVEVYTVDDFGEGEDSVLTGNYNKVKNGGFETDTDGDSLPDDWAVSEYDATSTAALDSTDQIEGLNSLKFTSTGLGGGYADSDYFEVREGKVITAIWAMKSSVVDVRNVVDILWYTSAKASISTTNLYDDSATNPTSWTEKTAEATPPATARFAKIRVTGCHSSDATSGSTWFDDVQVTDIANASTTKKGLVEKATQAEMDAGTADKYPSAAEVAAYQPPAVATDYIGGFKTYLHQNMSDTTLLAISGDIATGTYETVGPTGSGMTNIWAALDDVPSTASFIIVKIRSIVAMNTLGVANESASLNVYAANYAEAAPAQDVYHELVYKQTRCQVSTQQTQDEETKIHYIPVDSSGRFKLGYLEAATDPDHSSHSSLMWLVGWIE